MNRPAAVAAMLIACGTTGADLDPESASWVEETRRRLLVHDLDGSGLLEAEEVDRLPCAVFGRAIDDWERVSSTPFTAALGLVPGLLFRGEPLGFAPGSVSAIPALETRCGFLSASRGTSATVVDLSRLASAPTSTVWDREVAAILIAGHDLDQSGSLDSRLEIQDIPCEAFEELDRQVRTAADVGLVTLYGVEEGLVWIGPALGFDDDVRDELGERLVACELEPDFD